MKIGDAVRVIPSPYQDFIGKVANINTGDVGVIVGVPLGYGDVVDILINGVEVRYWMGLLEVVSETFQVD